MKYAKSFYYWAAFIPHGFASTTLDSALLDRIHAGLKSADQDSDHDDDSNEDLTMVILTLARNAYSEMEDQECTLSREWCDKRRAARD